MKLASEMVRECPFPFPSPPSTSSPVTQYNYCGDEQLLHLFGNQINTHFSSSFHTLLADLDSPDASLVLPWNSSLELYSSRSIHWCMLDRQSQAGSPSQSSSRRYLPCT